MEWIETTAKSVQEAKDMALDSLGVDEAEAEFEVLEEPKAGLFGRVRGQARVRARVVPKSPRLQRPDAVTDDAEAEGHFPDLGHRNDHLAEELSAECPFPVTASASGRSYNHRTPSSSTTSVPSTTAVITAPPTASRTRAASLTRDSTSPTRLISKKGIGRWSRWRA